MEVNEDFLREVGLSAMPEEQKQAFLDYVEGEIETRVGERICEGMSDEEIAVFDSMDDIDLLLWLKEKKPNFTEIVDQTIEEVKAEISSNRDKILSD